MTSPPVILKSVKATRGVRFGPTGNRLDTYLNWIFWNPVVISGESSVRVDFDGTKYQRIGDKVIVSLNMKFTKSAPPTGLITIGSLPIPASLDAVYTSAGNIDFNGAFITTCQLKIEPLVSTTNIVIDRNAVFVPGNLYHIKGEITYQANITRPVITSGQNNLITSLLRASRLTFDAGKNYLQNYTEWLTWTPTIVAGNGTQPTSTAGTKYQRIGNNVVVLLNLTFIKSAPSADLITLGTLPIPAKKATIASNDITLLTGPFISSGRAEVNPGISQVNMDIYHVAVFFAGLTYIVRGEITYEAS